MRPLILLGVWLVACSFAAETNSLEKPQRLIASQSRCEALAFSHDGRSVAAFLASEGVRVFDWLGGQEIGHLPIDNTGFGPLAFSSKGLIAAGGPEQKFVVLWEPGKGQAAEQAFHSTAPLDALAFSPTGDRLATGDRAGLIVIYSVDGGALIHKLNGHIAGIFCFAWSPDGALLASASGDNDICLWNPSTGALVRRIETLTHSTFALAWSQDGMTLYSGGASGTICAWNASTGARLRESAHQPDLILTLALSPNEQFLAAGGLNPAAFTGPANLTIYNPETFRAKRVIRAHNGAVSALTISQDSSIIFSASDVEPSVKLWQTVALQREKNRTVKTD
jgi:WD40 repeat protein